jgi:hypothetical protein
MARFKPFSETAESDGTVSFGKNFSTVGITRD